MKTDEGFAEVVARALPSGEDMDNMTTEDATREFIDALPDGYNADKLRAAIRRLIAIDADQYDIEAATELLDGRRLAGRTEDASK